MRRVAMVLALVACDEQARAPEPPPPAWLVAPPPTGFPLGALTGRLGRGQAPQPMVELGLTAARALPGPLTLPTAWSVPGDGPPRAIVFGSEADHPAVELVEVDAGRVVWRDRTACAAPVVGATADAIVCADANGIRAIGLDGAPKWKSPAAFIAFTDERIAVAGAGEAVILDAASGDELARVKLPRGVASDAIVASCGDAGRELFAAGLDGRLIRIAEAQGGPAISWAAPVGQVRAIRACDGDAVVVTQAGAQGTALISLARKTGALLARIDGVLGAWPARDGSDRLEVSTAAGVARYAADLTSSDVIPQLPPLGELLASHRDLRLVRATPRTAVLLDRDGVRAYLPLAAPGVVLGERALVAGQWTGAPGETLHRFALPPPWRRPLRTPSARPVAVDAELRDLPAIAPVSPDGFALPDTGMHGVAAIALDPADPAAVYALAVDRDGERAAVARADLAARRWRWQRVDGCGPGTPVGLAVAAGVVVCATRGAGGSSLVRATSRDGEARWDWSTPALDAIAAGGDAVVVHDAGRVAVLDAGDGHLRGHLASDDGAPVRVAIVAVDRATLVVTAGHGRVIARTGNGLIPVWSIAVAGVVQRLAASADGVLVALEDGDAYRVDARTAAVTALPGLGLVWDAAGDVVTGHTVGGPIPGEPLPLPVPKPVPLLRKPPRPAELPDQAPMSTPIPEAPPLGDSWQLTLYDLTGGLRARNDYALAAPTSLAPRGPAGSPLVVTSGRGRRDVLVLAPATGDPVRRVRLPDDAPEGTVFATVVGGAPITGVVLASPLRVVGF
ncbi:MAG TPA: hypothetical protein VGC42_21105 [Kofleriaceae bacterium]